MSMKMELVLVSEFRKLVESGGIHHVVATKNQTCKWHCFGVNPERGVCYYIKAARGSNQIREWSGLNFLGSFIEKLGIKKFTVQGLSSDG